MSTSQPQTVLAESKSDVLNDTVSSAAQKPFDETFGNYLLHGINEIYLPTTVQWWPQTVAWKVLAGVLICALGVWVYRAILRWQRNRYRREALAELRKIEQLSRADKSHMTKVPVLLKSTALKVFPRSDLANLSGDAWLNILNKSARGVFVKDSGDVLQKVAYQQTDDWQLSKTQKRALFTASKRWLKSHSLVDLDD